MQPQHEAPKQDLDPGFLSKVQERVRAMKEAAQRQQQFAAQPEQRTQQPVAPTQPQYQQHETAPKEQTADEAWLKDLLSGNNTTPAPQTTPDQPQQKAEQTQNSYTLQREEVERLTGYLEENQKYFNAIELEAKRRGMDPLKIAEALSKKPIHEVVDFAIGQSNNAIPTPPVQQQVQYQQQPVQPQPMQQQRPAMPDPVDIGRENRNTFLPPDEPVYGGNKNWAF
jgi:hypothetical protein